jgi:transposase
LLAAAEARAVGHGGIAAVRAATGISAPTIRAGLKELEAGVELPGRTRRPGAGRKKRIDEDPTLVADVAKLVDPETRGDPESPLLWSSKSTRKLAEELKALGHEVGADTVGDILRHLGFSLQGNRKTLEGSEHPDRDAQFQHINRQVTEFQAAGQPVVSVDTKKKELVGPFKNGGREWNPEGEPEEVLVHDFLIPDLGRASPYGVYDITRNEAWVSVGIDHDTARFAGETINRWWTSMGIGAYPQAERLLVTADGGGSNGSRVRLWKVALQELADKTGLEITVCHLPPGTSKWNKIEHRLFSFISMNWRGRPLVSHEVIVNLIAGTTTRSGLRVRSEIDPNVYPAGIKISDEEMASLNLVRHEFHGEWNYTIRPRVGNA